MKNTVKERLLELKTELEKALSLVEDPQPGLFTWAEAFGDRLRTLRKEMNKWMVIN